jgi:drug/metabolite transporter (DMT)-like permease
MENEPALKPWVAPARLAIGAIRPGRTAAAGVRLRPAGSGYHAGKARLGVGLALLAYSLLSLQDATIKWLVGALPVWQVLFGRSVVIVSVCLARGRGDLLRCAVTTQTRNMLLVRSAVALAAWLCYFTAARTLPLGQLLTLYFAAPVMVVLLAGPLLSERVGGARWAAIGVGFAGTVAATNPAALSASAATGLVLIAAALWAYGTILMRQIARRESSLVQMLFTNVFFLVATGLASALTWHAVTPAEAGLLFAAGALGGAGQFCLLEAARRAPASLTAPMEYTALIWAFLLGFAVWGDFPTRGVVTGACLIFAAGAILLVSERKA